MITSLVTALLLSQGVQAPRQFEGWAGFNPFGQSSSLVMRLPLAQTGAGFAEDAGTVSHVTWNGSALVDSRGNAWTQVGTVPQIAANALPTTAAAGAAGPYSSADYYEGSPAALMEWAGDFHATVAYWQSALAAQWLIGKTSAAVVTGWGAYTTAGGAVSFTLHDGSLKTVTSPIAGPVLGINVVTFGKIGGTCYVRLNYGANASLACGTMTSALSEFVRIGRTYQGASYATATQILEIHASTTAYSDTLHVAQVNRYFGLLGTKGETALLTRTTTKTCEVNGITWNVAAGAPCINPTGLLVERASTNYVLNNRTHPKAAEATGTLPTGAHVAWHEGTGTMTVAAGTATVTGLSCTTVSPGTLCTFNVTVGGTMAITTSAGTVTKAQIEGGSTKTSEIPTAGTAVARNADSITVANPRSGQAIQSECMSGFFTPYSGAWGVHDRYTLMHGQNGGAPSMNSLHRPTGWTNSLRGSDAGAGDSWIGYNAPALGSTGHLITASYSAAAPAATKLVVKVDGVTVTGGSFTDNATDGLITSATAFYYPGNNGGAAPSMDGYIRDFRVYKSSTCR